MFFPFYRFRIHAHDLATHEEHSDLGEQRIEAQKIDVGDVPVLLLVHRVDPIRAERGWSVRFGDGMELELDGALVLVVEELGRVRDELDVLF